MVETYLTARDNMCGIVLLLDLRRMPSREDLTLWHWLQVKKLKVIPVITKVDKLSKNKRHKQIASIAKILGCKAVELIEFSAITGEGKEALWRKLARMLEIPNGQ